MTYLVSVGVVCSMDADNEEQAVQRVIDNIDIVGPIGVPRVIDDKWVIDVEADQLGDE